MVIAGAGSAGKETLGILVSNSGSKTDVVFFDENKSLSKLILEKFKIISSNEEIRAFLLINPAFCVSIGNGRKREQIFKKLLSNGGKAHNVIHKSVVLLSDIEQNGTIIQPNVVISYNVKIGKSCMIHANSVIGHKVSIGNFVNISPLVSIVGPVEIGNYSFIGAGSVIFPNVKIGNHVVISAGSIVDKNVNDYECFE